MLLLLLWPRRREAWGRLRCRARQMASKGPWNVGRRPKEHGGGWRSKGRGQSHDGRRAAACLCIVYACVVCVCAWDVRGGIALLKRPCLVGLEAGQAREHRRPDTASNPQRRASPSTQKTKTATEANARHSLGSCVAWYLPKVVLKKHRKGQRKGPRTTTMFVVSPHDLSPHGLSMNCPSESKFGQPIAVLQFFFLSNPRCWTAVQLPKGSF